ncbi:MAG: ABC transporter permease [Clostridia bacterium]|nr:ABC transporter permease [Clostridia bacterium]
MKNNAIFKIFKKELDRFFKDRRTLIALLMPGILIYLMYSLMGNFMSDAFMPDDEYVPTIYSVNAPAEIETVFSQVGYTLTPSSDTETEKQAITDNEADLLIVFPENFMNDMLAYQPGSDLAAPNVEIYYNSASTNSATAFTTVTAVLDSIESSLSNKFDVNNSLDTQFDLATDEDVTGMIFSMMMPMLMMMLLFSGCMAVAPESIAGEKERGTIATLLITPTKRSHIAIGKILALSVMALISGTSSTVGTLLSLPKLMGGAVELSDATYNAADYVMLAAVILSTVLVFITLISIISAYAKTVKEAGTYLTPLMILSMLIGLSGMMGEAATERALYAIPIFNSVQNMIAIFSFNGDVINVIITVCANIAVTSIGVFVLTRMFNNEKIMFNK